MTLAAGIIGCVDDVYSGHGWTSVAAMAMSIPIPATAGVILADCAVHNIFGF